MIQLPFVPSQTFLIFLELSFYPSQRNFLVQCPALAVPRPVVGLDKRIRSFLLSQNSDYIELPREERRRRRHQTLPARKSAPSMKHNLRQLILKSADSDLVLRILEKAIEKDVVLRSFVSTTRAIDLIHGGVKTNALPEQAWAVINHRIATQR